MSNYLIGGVDRYAALISIILNRENDADGKKNDKQEKCVISVYENPKVAHISSFCEVRRHFFKGAEKPMRAGLTFYEKM